MTTLTYGSGNVAVPETKPKAARKHWLTRLVDKIAEAQMRKAERDIAHYRHLLPKDFERQAWKVGPRSEDQLPFIR